MKKLICLNLDVLRSYCDTRTRATVICFFFIVKAVINKTGFTSSPIHVKNAERSVKANVRRYSTGFK